jgi:hypothetical protein
MKVRNVRVLDINVNAERKSPRGLYADAPTARQAITFCDVSSYRRDRELFYVVAIVMHGIIIATLSIFDVADPVSGVVKNSTKIPVS